MNIHPSHIKYFQPTSTVRSRPWEARKPVVRSRDNFTSGLEPIREIPKSFQAEAVAKMDDAKSAKPAGSTWDRLMSYFFFPSDLNMNNVIETGKNLVNSLGQDYGKNLTAKDANVQPEVAKAQRFVQDMAQKIGGEALKKAGLDFKVNIYASDRPDSFARVSPEAPKKSFFQKVKSVFGSKDKPAPIEIGITVGALKNLKTEDEIAFLVAREVAKAVDGDHEVTIGNMVKSQGNQVAADAEAFSMMTKAGYDPAMGLNSLNELVKHQNPGNDSLADALDAAISPSHQQGVRMALGQMNVEMLRRTEAAAHPQAVHKSLPEDIRTKLPSEKVANPLTDTVVSLAKAYATSPLGVNHDGVLGPKFGTARHELSTKKWDAVDAGDALATGLKALKNLSPQDKATRGLGLVQALSAQGWYNGGPAVMGDEVQEFFAGAKGWKAEEVLETLKTSDDNGNNASADFAFQVLLNPKFQSVVSPLMKDDPEWTKLFQAAPQLLATSKDGTQEAVQEQLSGAFGFLAGQERSEEYPLYRQLPASIEPGAGPLDGMIRQEFTKFMKTQSISGRENIEDFATKVDGALQPEFAAEMQEILKPGMSELEAKRDQLMSKIKLDQEEVSELFKLLELVPASQDKQAALLENLVSSDGTIEFFNGESFTSNPTWAQFLGDALSSDKVPASTKEVVFNKMIQTMPSKGVRGFEPGTKELVEYTKGKSNLELLGMVELEIANNGIGSKLNEYGEAPVHGNPLMSLLGSNRELSTRVAGTTHALQFDAWLEKLQSDETHRFDHGARRFMLDTMLANQGKEAKLTEWAGRVNTIVDAYTLELNPDLKPRMQEFLVPTLEKLESKELRAALNTEPVMKVLSKQQAADFLVEVLQPATMKGQDAKLHSELVALEKEFGIGDRPTLKNEIYAQVADAAKLQPHNVDEVLPNVTTPSADMAKTLDKEIRGLSALTAAARTRPAKEQLATVEYLMGRSPDMPAYFQSMEDQAYSMLADMDPRIVEELQANGATAAVLMEGLRNFLDSSDVLVRTAVSASFLAGPSGLLGTESGRDLLLETFLGPVKEQAGAQLGGLAENLALAALTAEEKTAGATGGYLLAQKLPEPEAGGEVEEMSEGKILHHIFQGYSTPGTKMEQYLAFSGDFKQYEKDFEKSQDSAREMTYLDGIKLIQHHYGDNWPAHRTVEKIIGNGSVNVAIMFKDEQKDKRQVVQMPIPAAEVQSNYDFHRLASTIDALLENPKMKEDFGYMEGLLKVLKKSVSLEFDRAAAFKMQKDVENFYKRDIDGWHVSSVPADKLEGDAIIMDLASGKTARKILGTDPEVYKSAMSALGRLETDALAGQGKGTGFLPVGLHANADFHDGQVLIDVENKKVQLLDFAQCVPISVEEQAYALDVATIVGKARKPAKAAEVLSERSGVDVPVEVMEKIMESDDPMDMFIQILGYLANEDAAMPLGSVHWILMANRRRALQEKIGGDYMTTLKLMGASHLVTGSLAPYNAVRMGVQTAKDVVGSLVGGVNSVATSLLGEE